MRRPTRFPRPPTSPREPLRFRSERTGSLDRLRRDETGAPILFEAVTELPPAESSELGRPFDFAPPESNVSGALGEGTSSEMSGALGTRVVKGVSWTLAGTLWTQALGVVRTIALARLLSLGDFGLAAMALTVIGALYTLTNTGVVASVVSGRFEDDDEMHRYVNLVWTLEIARGALISLLLLATSGVFARFFYHEPALTPLLVALSLTPICTSLQNVGLFLNQRRVEMRSLTFHGFWTNTLGVLLTLILAFLTRNYWALVWGQILGAFTGTALSFVFSSYRPRLGFDRSLLRRAFDFGKHQFVIGLANYVLTMMDNVAVGYFLGKNVLGMYVVAYSFCTLARTVVNNAFNTVLFPAFAAAGREDDPNRLRALVERVFTMGTLGLIALLAPLVAFAPAVLRVFYGTKWGSAATSMRLLLVAGFFAGLLSLFSAFFVGLDRPQVESKGKIWDALLFLAVLIPLTRHFGAPGAALTGIIAWAGASIWRWKWAHDLAPGALRRLPFLLGSALLIGAVACALGGLPWHGIAGGLPHLFDETAPTLLTAWVQLLVGAPFVALFSTGAFTLVNPVARREVTGLLGRFDARRGRARD